MEGNLGGSRVNHSKAQIINTFLGKLKNKTIDSKEGFEELYEKSMKYAAQLDLVGDYKSLSIFWEKIEELEKMGKSRDEILSLVPEETKDIVEDEFKVKDLLELEPIEILKKLENPECDMYELINDSIFADHYSAIVARNMFRGLTDEELSISLVREIRYGLGSYILEKGLNLDTLGIEKINLIASRGITVNLYNATGDEIDYIATLSSASEEGDFEEFRLCTDEEYEKILEENSDIIPGGVIMISESGSIIEYTGANEYIFVDEDGDVYENYGETSYHKSYAEELYRRIKDSGERYIKLQTLGAPQQICKTEAGMIDELKEIHATITRGSRKFTPNDVEKATEDITLEDVQKMLEEMTGPKNTREESLEKGIGFDEH